MFCTENFFKNILHYFNLRLFNFSFCLSGKLFDGGIAISLMQYLTILDEEPICRFISGSHDQTILIWEWHREENSMECVHACRGHAGSVDCVAVNDDKDKVSGY